MTIPEQAVEKAAKALMDELYDGCASLPEDHPAHLPIYDVCRKRARVALSAAAPFMAAQWQPIETAPKDEDLLLGWWQRWPHHPIIWEITVNLAGSTKGGWLHGQATHWQPLPAAPIIAEHRGEG